MTDWLSTVRLILTAVFMAAGVFVIISSLLGVYRFKFALNRIHSAALTDTLGFGLIIIGLMISSESLFSVLKLLALLVFMWLTNPVASHMLAKLEVVTDKEIEHHCKVSEEDLDTIRNDHIKGKEK
ncbi:MAG: monovalent cation/H(+) antiporter subunit G [Ruminococcaceae bacterium]|nr:monovalent cation/H(+) antiporter subunit G [Oscillospiraceae bacterium]